MQNNQNDQNINISSNQEDDQTSIPYNQIKFLDTIVASNEKNILKFLQSESFFCCNCHGKGILGKINYFLIFSIIALIFGISGIISSFNCSPQYNDLRNILLIQLEKEKLLSNFKSNFNIKHLWCNLRWKQNAVYIPNTILFILVLIFELIQKKYYKQCF